MTSGKLGKASPLQIECDAVHAPASFSPPPRTGRSERRHQCHRKAKELGPPRRADPRSGDIQGLSGITGSPESGQAHSHTQRAPELWRPCDVRGDSPRLRMAEHDPLMLPSGAVNPCAGRGGHQPQTGEDEHVGPISDEDAAELKKRAERLRDCAWQARALAHRLGPTSTTR